MLRRLCQCNSGHVLILKHNLRLEQARIKEMVDSEAV
jgi:hypothetical protein